ncbi:lanthionine synthetase C family protein [Myxococcaceae bacterium GXIMD 01537]
MRQWTTLLEGPLRERALRVVEDITQELKHHREQPGPSLSGGLAGRALLFAELDRSSPGADHRAHAERLILAAADGISQTPLAPWLYGGFSGIAWAIERVAKLGVPSIDDMSEVDDALLGLVSRQPWSQDYDLIRGLVGLGLYAHARLPRPSARECLTAVVQRLAERSTRSPPGVSWWTPPQHLPAHERTVYTEGYFNLGAAHGVPAVVALLALAAQAGVGGTTARELARDGARWVLANALPDSPGARYPACVAPGVTARPCRSAWCYGDPGVALCLLTAAQALSDAELERAAVEIASEAARRPAAHSGVQDAGLCHGAAGLAHIYHRLHQASGSPLLKEAAVAWFTQTLELRRPGEGIAGYCSWSRPPGQQSELTWVADTSLLTGATGVALALHSACHPHPPSWDGLLMATPSA